MYEDRTFEAIMKEVLATGDSLGVDTRQGSIFYDAVAGVVMKHAMFYTDLRHAIDLCFVDTAVGTYLDKKGAEYNIFRSGAVPARYHFEYLGTTPAEGERFFAEGRYFYLVQRDEQLLLEAEEHGIRDNNILPQTAAIPVNNLSGLSSASFGDLYEPGAEQEDDESYRQRIREKLAGPAENGNRQHYKTWCEEVTGVGRARIIPLFAGENTVMGVIYGMDGLPAVDAVVQRVQEYIDPIDEGQLLEYEGRTILAGDGNGNGVANIGAHFAAVAADSLGVRVSFTAVLASGGSKERLIEEATEALQEHFRSMALNTLENETVVVRLSTIGAILHDLPSLLDYDDLTLNETARNIELKLTEVAILEGVTVNV